MLLHSFASLQPHTQQPLHDAFPLILSLLQRAAEASPNQVKLVRPAEGTKPSPGQFALRDGSDDLRMSCYSSAPQDEGVPDCGSSLAQASRAFLMSEQSPWSQKGFYLPRLAGLHHPKIYATNAPQLLAPLVRVQRDLHLSDPTLQTKLPPHPPASRWTAI